MAKKKAKSPSKSTAARKPTVARLRRKIDKLDCEIVVLLNERAKLATEVGALKRSDGESTYAPEREEQVLAKVVERSEGPLSDACIRHVFREAISGCRALEKSTRVAFLGPRYTYSHLAVIERFGQTVDLAPVASISAVFEEVAREQADFGIVPVENSTDGRVTDTLAMFAKTPLTISGEVQLRIHHHLLARCERDEIRQVYSKPQALSQCRNWLARHLPQAQLIEISSTAEAAQLACEKSGVAAIAGAQAAAHLGLDVLASSIEDDPENLTRFAVIGYQPAERTGDDKTSLMFETQHRPGALADAMAIFKRGRLNLTWIESFPIPGSPGQYLFFVELVGHQKDVRVRRAIASLEKKSTRLRTLGSYARSEPIG